MDGCICADKIKEMERREVDFSSRIKYFGPSRTLTRQSGTPMYTVCVCVCVCVCVYVHYTHWLHTSRLRTHAHTIRIHLHSLTDLQPTVMDDQGVLERPMLLFTKDGIEEVFLDLDIYRCRDMCTRNSYRYIL